MSPCSSKIRCIVVEYGTLNYGAVEKRSCFVGRGEKVADNVKCSAGLSKESNSRWITTKIGNEAMKPFEEVALIAKTYQILTSACA